MLVFGASIVISKDAPKMDTTLQANSEPWIERTRSAEVADGRRRGTCLEMDGKAA